MTDLAKLDALIERLEKAEEPALELNAEIALAVDGWRAWKSKHGHWVFEGPHGAKYEVEGRHPSVKFDPETGERLPEEIVPVNSFAWLADLPDYTGSLDAAVALFGKLCPGWVWHKRSHYLASVFNPSFGDGSWNTEYESSCDIFSISLVAATLKAYRAKFQGKSEAT